MEIIKYPDKSSYVTVDPKEKGKNIIFKINSYEDLWHLNQYVDALNNVGVTPHIIIPCLIDAQADKRFANNQSSGLLLVTRLLNSMKATFTIFHPHNPEVLESLMPNVKIINNTEYIKTVLKKLGQTDGTDESMILMSSDAGGFKPLMNLCKELNWKGLTYSAAKHRSWSLADGTKFIQEIGRRDFEKKDILIIDDLCIYGGTFKGLSSILRDRNVGNLYLATTHATIQNLGDDPVTNYFDRVFFTNSKHDSYGTSDKSEELKPIGNLDVLDLF